ncbi:hypothetical protein [Glaciecola sp. KUL10]|uniref:hypothetical protein n=1 Tax=Glaciecola sp. (strain KUL10) TaxID=2161813 RepID=UPI000D78767B|nr:hypothetical protein [Glaciecola sp. KUL10]GBL03158.1 hypothetical protein KUL10_04390 [Glaciecola sp. KUL10]
MPKDESNLELYLSSSLSALFELAFIFLPALAWAATILSLGGSPEEVKRLAAWPFVSLALFSATLKDGIAAFHRDTPKDKRQRKAVITVSILGIVLSTVLLTLAIIDSKQSEIALFDYFYEFVYLLVFCGATLVFVTKAILAQREDFDHYV